MTLRLYLGSMSLASFICWAIFLFIINIIDPYATNALGFVAFYLSISLALIGTTAMIGFLVRFVWLKQRLAFRAVIEAFRQSFLFTLFIVISLILSSKDLFDWVNLLLLIIILSIIEFFILGYSQEIANRKPIPAIKNNNEPQKEL